MQFSHFFPNAAELTPLPEGGEPRVHPVLKKRQYCIKSMANRYYTGAEERPRVFSGEFVFPCG